MLHSDLVSIVGAIFAQWGTVIPSCLCRFLGPLSLQMVGPTHRLTVSPANTTTLTASGTITYSMFNLRWGAVFFFSVSRDLKGRFSSSCRDTIVYVLDLEKWWKNWSGVCRIQTQEVFTDVYVSKLRTGSSATQKIQQSSSALDESRTLYSRPTRHLPALRKEQNIFKIWFQLNNVTSSNRLILSKT